MKIIGRKDWVDFFVFGFEKVFVKIDMGVYFCFIYCEFVWYVKIVEENYLEVVFFDLGILGYIGKI